MLVYANVKWTLKKNGTGYQYYKIYISICYRKDEIVCCSELMP